MIRGRSATGPGPRRAIIATALAAPESSCWQPFDQGQGRMPRDLRKRIELAGRVKALRHAIRLDNFSLAQHLRKGLAASLRHLEGPLRDDVAQLFEISGLWLRNVGDRRNDRDGRT